MTDPVPPSPDHEPNGQTPQTRAWVARRNATTLAIEADRVRAAKERALVRHQHERSQQQASPMSLIIGIIILLCLLLTALWVFIDRLECDPMWSDRGLSSLCKPPPQ